MSAASQGSGKASLCTTKPTGFRIIFFFFISQDHKEDIKKMYNPAKISSKRAPPVGPNIQYRVSVINTAMHYINLQLISVFIYYTLKTREQNIQHHLISTQIAVEFRCFWEVIFYTYPGTFDQKGCCQPLPPCCYVRHSTAVL